MTTMKPIQPTPELSGNDAIKVFQQSKKKPTAQAAKKNQMLCSVLASVRK